MNYCNVKSFVNYTKEGKEERKKKKKNHKELIEIFHENISLFVSSFLLMRKKKLS